MSVTWIVPVVTVLALLVGIANTVWLWWSKSSDSNATKIKGIESELADHLKRIGAIEGEMRHLPTKDAVNAITVKVTEMNGKFGVLDAEVSSVGRTVRRIEDILLTGSKAA